MVTVELIGGPLDGEVRAIPSLSGEIEFVVCAPPSFDAISESDTLKPIKPRKVYYTHAGGNRYVWQDMTPAFR